MQLNYSLTVEESDALRTNLAAMDATLRDLRRELMRGMVPPPGFFYGIQVEVLGLRYDADGKPLPAAPEPDDWAKIIASANRAFAQAADPSQNPLRGGDTGDWGE